MVAWSHVCTVGVYPRFLLIAFDFLDVLGRAFVIYVVW